MPIGPVVDVYYTLPASLITAAACVGDGVSSVIQGVYEALLSKRGSDITDGGTSSTAIRLQLLRSLAAFCQIVLEEDLKSALPGQVGAACFNGIDTSI